MIAKRLTSVYEATGIPMCYVDNEFNLITFPKFEDGILPIEFVTSLLQDFESKNRDIMYPLVQLLEPSCFIGIIKISLGHYLILGPVSPYRLSQEQILAFASNVIYPDKLRTFCDIVLSAPTFPYRRFLNTLSLSANLLVGVDISIDDILLSNQSSSKIEQSSVLYQDNDNVLAHVPQSWEVGVLSAIESGDVSLLKKRIAEPVYGKVGQMSPDPLTQEKYTFISFITLVTRAALKGGLNAEIAYKLSDMYSQQMDLLSNVQEIATLTYQMALDFCGKVREYGRSVNYSSLVGRLCDFITLNLHENISLDDLSKFCGLNKKSMSKKFSSEIGLSIPDYINKQKMTEAAHLLKNTDYSITDIGYFLNYGSQSYFTKIFRETYGKTPLHYRTCGSL